MKPIASRVRLPSLASYLFPGMQGFHFVCTTGVLCTFVHRRPCTVVGRWSNRFLTHRPRANPRGGESKGAIASPWRHPLWMSGAQQNARAVRYRCLKVSDSVQCWCRSPLPAADFAAVIWQDLFRQMRPFGQIVSATCRLDFGNTH